MGRKRQLSARFMSEDFKGLYVKKGGQKFGIRLLGMLLLQEGKSNKEVSLLLQKNENTIKYWIDCYESGGVAGLLSIKEGRGIKSKTATIEASLKEEIIQLANSYKGGRVRGTDIQSFLLSRYNIHYCLSSCYNLLHRLGFSWITSRSKHPNSNPEAQEVFKKGTQE